MSKLTLSVDEDVIARAKRLADRRGTSVSALVEQYLDLITRPPTVRDEHPVVTRLRGILSGADVASYHRYLERKYR